MIEITKLEKLAKAADLAKGKTLTHFLGDNQRFKELANPAAILELISINRELVNALEASLSSVAKANNKWVFEVAKKALARANGESNVGKR